MLLDYLSQTRILCIHFPVCLSQPQAMVCSSPHPVSARSLLLLNSLAWQHCCCHVLFNLVQVDVPPKQFGLSDVQIQEQAKTGPPLVLKHALSVPRHWWSSGRTLQQDVGEGSGRRGADTEICQAEY